MDNLEIIKYYLEGNSLSKTSRTYEISIYVLKKILTSNNIHIRNQSEQCVIENIKRRKKVDDTFFSKLTQENVYYIGFIAADGTIRKDRNAIKIGLQAGDKQWLEDFRKSLQLEKEISEYTTKTGHKVARLEFSSKQIKEDLAKYSIVPNKTQIGITMRNIPDEYKLAFIKGFFDGDGSYTCGKVKITSNTEGILKEIRDFIPQKSYLYYTNRHLYSLEMSTIPSLDFLNSIYNLNTPCLQRKYDKYLVEKQSRI